MERRRGGDEIEAELEARARATRIASGPAKLYGSQFATSANATRSRPRTVIAG